jgi:hypothetical protein
MLHEVGFRTECQAANSGVQAIRANHKIKPSGRSAVEDHIDTTVVWMKLIDHLVEQELRICAARVYQDRAEVCSWHLNLAIFGLPRSDARHALTDVVNEDQFAHLRSGLLQPRHDTQQLSDSVGTLADVHWIAAGSDTLVTFYDGYPVSGATQQRRQRRTGDSGA